MSIEPFARANSRPLALPAVQAEPNLLEKLHPLPAPRRAEKFFGRVKPVMQFGTNQAAAAYDFVEDRTSITPQPSQMLLVYISSQRFPTPDARPFLLIERVKKLLGQQKIRDARRTLEIGSIRHPEDRQIASLLRAISPGRVSPTGWASTGRERETTWIKQHGYEYRGKWIALDEDRLIALADTLNELLAKLDTSSERKKPPFIQHLMSE